MKLKAPFPYFGGKSRVAGEIWRRFGVVNNYVEPFFGSGAVLLARPDLRGLETVNDIDGMICNFWRAIQHDPDAVAYWADWPVNEADLHARHYWLVTEGRNILASKLGDPEGYDAKVAGWWVWGIGAWIGSGFCSGNGPWQWSGSEWVKQDGGVGITRKLPNMSAVKGVHAKSLRGVGLQGWFQALSDRLRYVRVAHGDWSRVVRDSVTWRNGTTAVFLDPPYARGNRSDCYAHESDCSGEVREWAIVAGQRDDMRICLAGYEGEHDMPSDWTVVRWKARGGYGNQGNKRGRQNAARETLWFSPACEVPVEISSGEQDE